MQMLLTSGTSPEGQDKVLAEARAREARVNSKSFIQIYLISTKFQIYQKFKLTFKLTFKLDII